MCIVQTLDKGKRQIREQGTGKRVSKRERKKKNREREKDRRGSKKEKSEQSKGYVQRVTVIRRRQEAWKQQKL